MITRLIALLPETKVMARTLREVDASSGRALTVHRGATDQASPDVIDPVTIQVFQAFLAGLRSDLPEVEARIAPSSNFAMLADELGDDKARARWSTAKSGFRFTGRRISLAWR